MLTETMERRPEIGFASYDRFFPSQDNMPIGGFGNLITLPLQRRSRDLGNSVFIDDDLRPYEDQWAFLASIPRLSVNAAAEIVSLCRDARPRSRRPHAGRGRGCGRTVAHDAVSTPEARSARHPTSGQNHHRRLRPAVDRTDRLAVGHDGTAYALGSLSEPRVLSCAIYEAPDLRQATDNLLRRTTSSSYWVAARVS